MKCLIALVIPIVVSATDMTTRVEVYQYDHGAWSFTNTSNKHLRCNMGLTEYPRWRASVMSKSPSLKEPFEVTGTIGNRNFNLEPYDRYVYSRPNVGTVYCVLNNQ